MFREMRRFKQALRRGECERILSEATSGVLALSGDDGYPYALPLSFAFDGNRLIFHGATSGHKLDAIKREPRASFCVVSQDLVVPERFTTHFKSVIVFGRCRILTDASEIHSAAQKLARRYSPDESDESIEHEIASSLGRLCIFVLQIEHMTGKQAVELVDGNNNGA